MKFIPSSLENPTSHEAQSLISRIKPYHGAIAFYHDINDDARIGVACDDSVESEIKSAVFEWTENITEEREKLDHKNTFRVVIVTFPWNYGTKTEIRLYPTTRSNNDIKKDLKTLYGQNVKIQYPEIDYHDCLFYKLGES